MKSLLPALLVALVTTPVVLGQEPSILPVEETVTINLSNQDLAEVLEMFSANYGLNLVYGPNVQGTVSLNLKNAPVREALERILAANGFRAMVEGQFLTVVPLANEDGSLIATTKYEPLVLRLNHLRAEEVEPMIKPLLAPGETLIVAPSASSGLDSMSELGGNELATGEMMLLMASAETQKRIQTLLQQLDTPPLQVLVEATIMAISLTDDSTLGVDFTALGGIDFQAMGGSTSVTDGFTGANVGGSQLQDWLLGLSQRGFTDPSASGLHVGILRNQVGMFIHALEDVGNATVLSNPHVLTLNRHAAQVLVGRKIGYQTTTTTMTTTVQDVNFLEVGTSLSFRPFISEDGWVRMEIHPENSDGSINPTTGLPDESTTEVSTNILVRSGHTVVIGGLMENSVATTVSQIPVLGNIPWLGALFRQESQSESRTEIIVMLTPHIVDEEGLDRRANEAQRRFAAAQARLTASHHGYLRPSYARRMYVEATDALASGNAELALARAEWGLTAMPADPDLAAFAEHCARQLQSKIEEDDELRESLRLIEEMERGVQR